MLKDKLASPILAILFAAQEPVTFDQLGSIFPDAEGQAIRDALDVVKEQVASLGSLELRSVAGGYRITTLPEFHDTVRSYLRTKPSSKLSLAALETLAVIAYKQPATLPEIMDIRGVKGTSTIRTLLEKKLIETRGRKKVVGRPILYGTTREFLVHFGLNDLSELPTLEEFEELVAQIEESNIG